MASVSAAMVKDLREKTGAGMMDCKAALGETSGDIEAAVDWLRKKGLAKAAKKAGRTAAEGLVGVESPGRSAAILEDLPAANVNEPVEPTEAFELLAAPRGAPDDLTKLTGVGPQLANKLNDAGIFHYWQLGAMKDEDVAKLDADLKLNGRITRDNWVGQARTLLEAA